MMTVSWCQLCSGVQTVIMAESSGNGCFVFQWSAGWSQQIRQAGLPACTPWEVSEPRPSCFVRKWVQPKSFGSQSNDGPEFFERISWIVSWKWDLRLDHLAQHPGLLSESLEWFWIYPDVKRGRINPFFPTSAHGEELPAQFTVLGVLFPPISSLPHILQILRLYMKNRSFQMAPVGAI